MISLAISNNERQRHRFPILPIYLVITVYSHFLTSENARDYKLALEHVNNVVQHVIITLYTVHCLCVSMHVEM